MLQLLLGAASMTTDPATAAVVQEKSVFLSHLLIEQTSWTRCVEGGMWILAVDASVPVEPRCCRGFCPWK